MAAAIADFTPAEPLKTKLEKNSLSALKIKKNADIVKGLRRKKGSKILIGFAAETGDNTGRAKEKLKAKNLDLIVFNNVMQKGAGFDVERIS